MRQDEGLAALGRRRAQDQALDKIDQPRAVPTTAHAGALVDRQQQHLGDQPRGIFAASAHDAEGAAAEHAAAGNVRGDHRVIRLVAVDHVE